METDAGMLFQMAVMHNEMYNSWVNAGFTEDQAFQLTRDMVTAMFLNTGRQSEE